ncbi:MAG: BON domain-containing protein [Verrucomicrobia bacterium]|nr:BON domain-containing protein [Cytophagales bacterium]
MGVLDFINEESAENVGDILTKRIMEEGLQVDDLSVDYANGVVSISGTAATEADKSKILEMAGGIIGVSEVRDNMQTTSSESTEETTKSDKKTYTVKFGDTMWGIAQHYYGNGALYTKIFEHNRELWAKYNYNPNYLYPGWVLVIP